MFNNTTEPFTMPVVPAGYGNCNGNNGMWGDGGWWVIILFALIFGWGGNGNGFGGNGNSFTDSAVQRGFDNQSVLNKLNGIENGLCDGFYAQNTTMLNGFNGVQRDLCSGFNGVNQNINQARFDAQQCCCETNRNIDSVRYENAKNTCDIINAGNANTQRIIDTLTQNQMQDLRDQLNTANLQLSQQAQSANLINQLRPCPIPAYLSCSPYTSYDPFRNGYGYGGCGCGNNSGCGCC